MARHNFRDLKVWQKSRLAVKYIYVLSADFPNEEKFGIISQIRKAAVSISCNISEGAGRGTDKDFARFLDLAEGSANEVINLLFLSFDLEFISEEQLNHFLERYEEINKMLVGLRNNLNN